MYFREKTTEDMDWIQLIVNMANSIENDDFFVCEKLHEAVSSLTIQRQMNEGSIEKDLEGDHGLFDNIDLTVATE